MAVGGAAYLVAKAIKKARVVAFEDLGMEQSTNLKSKICQSLLLWIQRARMRTKSAQILGGSKSLKRPSKGLPLSSQRGTWQKMTKVHVSCTFLIGYLSYSKL